jgi:hypothetical protein
MSDWNERLLKEIAHLRYLQSIGIENPRVTHCIEMLRFVRNDELGLTFEQGKLEEDEYIETTYNESNYGKIGKS